MNTKYNTVQKIGVSQDFFKNKINYYADFNLFD